MREDHRKGMNAKPARLHHVGIVVPYEEQANELIDLLGLQEQGRGYVDHYQALCIFTKGNGGSPLELVVPTGGQLTRFNQGLGGLHHVAIAVESLLELTDRLKTRGIRLLEDRPVRGAGHFLCNFLAPIYTRGVIVEFVEELHPSAIATKSKKSALAHGETDHRQPARSDDSGLSTPPGPTSQDRGRAAGSGDVIIDA
jgi:methylmalonyl-CoA/ethylmalonyl-CoA epimerase